MNFISLLRANRVQLQGKRAHLMIKDTTDFTNLNPRELLKDLTPQDFLDFGIQEVAYIRPVDIAGGEREYAIHAADGTPLSVMESMDSAMVAARHNELEPLILQ